MSRHNANFRDPFGLVGRMLASGNKAAYAALIREVLRHAATPIDAILSRFEKRHFRVPRESRHPLVLIIGMPRSGTTLVYQTLAAHLDVTFPSNLSAILKRSPISAVRAQRRFCRRTRPDFQSYYGQTSRLSDCNDGFDIWNRWLGEDRYYPRKSLTDEQSVDMRTFFNAWTNVFGRPFLNKNNRNAFAVQLLAEHLPTAKFVVVRRNPIFVAQSLIVAREKVQGSKQTGWGLESSSASGQEDDLAYVDAVCQQITKIDDEMNRQLSAVHPARIIEVTYEGFCEFPQQTIGRVVSRFEGLEIASASEIRKLKSFPVSQTLTISPAEQQRIRRCLGIDASVSAAKN